MALLKAAKFGNSWRRSTRGDSQIADLNARAPDEEDFEKAMPRAAEAKASAM